MNRKKLSLAIYWHMHQPVYELEGTYLMPWVRLHAIKDYLDMVLILEKFPKLKLNFNIVPALLDAIIDYGEKGSNDIHSELTTIDTDNLSDEEKSFILNNFFNTKFETMVYKNETYSVRDNGAVMRHSRENGIKRKLDEIWTFGSSVNGHGYLFIGTETVHRIVAKAFLGEPPSDKYIVDHIDTNRQNNRPTNLRWLTKLENIISNPITCKRIEMATGLPIQEVLSDMSVLHNCKLPKNFEWMRSVSQEESAACLENLSTWAKSKNFPKTENRGAIGEWIFHPQNMFAERNVFCKSKWFTSLVSETAFHNNTIIIKTENADKDAIKPWAIALITFEDNLYIHKTYTTCFEKISADKYFTILQDKEWTGDDVPYDFC